MKSGFQPDRADNTKPGQKSNAPDYSRPFLSAAGQIQADDKRGKSGDPQQAACSRPFSHSLLLLFLMR